MPTVKESSVSECFFKSCWENHVWEIHDSRAVHIVQP